MKRKKFCISLLSLLLACTMLFSFPVESRAASRNTAYCKVLKSLEKKYGKLKIHRMTNVGSYYAGNKCYSKVYYATGVCCAKLIDLNNDGTEELLVSYCKKVKYWKGQYSSSFYRTRVYTYKAGKAVFSGEIPTAYGQQGQAYLNIGKLGSTRLIFSMKEDSLTYTWYGLNSKGKLVQKFKIYEKYSGLVVKTKF